MLNRETIKNIVVTTLLNYEPVYIGMFGSFSRGEQKKESDLDLLVKFKKKLSLLNLIHLENRLSEKLGLKVDLITEGALTNQKIKKEIEKDLQLLYQAWKMTGYI